MEDTQALIINQTTLAQPFSLGRKKFSQEKKLKINSQDVPAYSIELRCPECHKRI